MCGRGCARAKLTSHELDPMIHPLFRARSITDRSTDRPDVRSNKPADGENWGLGWCLRVRASQKGVDAGFNRTLGHQIGDHRLVYSRKSRCEFICHGSRVKDLGAIAKRFRSRSLWRAQDHRSYPFSRQERPFLAQHRSPVISLGEFPPEEWASFSTGENRSGGPPNCGKRGCSIFRQFIERVSSSQLAQCVSVSNPRRP